MHPSQDPLSREAQQMKLDLKKCEEKLKRSEERVKKCDSENKLLKIHNKKITEQLEQLKVVYKKCEEKLKNSEDRVKKFDENEQLKIKEKTTDQLEPNNGEARTKKLEDENELLKIHNKTMLEQLEQLKVVYKEWEEKFKISKDENELLKTKNRKLAEHLICSKSLMDKYANNMNDKFTLKQMRSTLRLRKEMISNEGVIRRMLGMIGELRTTQNQIDLRYNNCISALNDKSELCKVIENKYLNSEFQLKQSQYKVLELESKIKELKGQLKILRNTLRKKGDGSFSSYTSVLTPESSVDSVEDTASNSSVEHRTVTESLEQLKTTGLKISTNHPVEPMETKEILQTDDPINSWVLKTSNMKLNNNFKCEKVEIISDTSEEDDDIETHANFKKLSEGNKFKLKLKKNPLTINAISKKQDSDKAAFKEIQPCAVKINKTKLEQVQYLETFTNAVPDKAEKGANLEILLRNSDSSPMNNEEILMKDTQSCENVDYIYILETGKTQKKSKIDVSLTISDVSPNKEKCNQTQNSLSIPECPSTHEEDWSDDEMLSLSSVDSNDVYSILRVYSSYPACISPINDGFSSTLSELETENTSIEIVNREKCPSKLAKESSLTTCTESSENPLDMPLIEEMERSNIVAIPEFKKTIVEKEPKNVEKKEPTLVIPTNSDGCQELNGYKDEIRKEVSKNSISIENLPSTCLQTNSQKSLLSKPEKEFKYTKESPKQSYDETLNKGSNTLLALNLSSSVLNTTNLNLVEENDNALDLRTHVLIDLPLDLSVKKKVIKPNLSYSSQNLEMFTKKKEEKNAPNKSCTFIEEKISPDTTCTPKRESKISTAGNQINNSVENDIQTPSTISCCLKPDYQTTTSSKNTSEILENSSGFNLKNESTLGTTPKGKDTLRTPILVPLSLPCLETHGIELIPPKSPASETSIQPTSKPKSKPKVKRTHSLHEHPYDRNTSKQSLPQTCTYPRSPRGLNNYNLRQNITIPNYDQSSSARCHRSPKPKQKLVPECENSPEPSQKTTIKFNKSPIPGTTKLEKSSLNCRANSFHTQSGSEDQMNYDTKAQDAAVPVDTPLAINIPQHMCSPSDLLKTMDHEDEITRVTHIIQEVQVVKTTQPLKVSTSDDKNKVTLGDSQKDKNRFSCCNVNNQRQPLLKRTLTKEMVKRRSFHLKKILRELTCKSTIVSSSEKQNEISSSENSSTFTDDISSIQEKNCLAETKLTCYSSNKKSNDTVFKTKCSIDFKSKDRGRYLESELPSNGDIQRKAYRSVRKFQQIINSASASETYISDVSQTSIDNLCIDCECVDKNNCTEEIFFDFITKSMYYNPTESLRIPAICTKPKINSQRPESKRAVLTAGSKPKDGSSISDTETEWKTNHLRYNCKLQSETKEIPLTETRIINGEILNIDCKNHDSENPSTGEACLVMEVDDELRNALHLISPKSSHDMISPNSSLKSELDMVPPAQEKYPSSDSEDGLILDIADDLDEDENSETFYPSGSSGTSGLTEVEKQFLGISDNTLKRKNLLNLDVQSPLQHIEPSWKRRPVTFYNEVLLPTNFDFSECKSRFPPDKPPDPLSMTQNDKPPKESKSDVLVPNFYIENKTQSAHVPEKIPPTSDEVPLMKETLFELPLKSEKNKKPFHDYCPSGEKALFTESPFWTAIQSFNTSHSDYLMKNNNHRRKIDQASETTTEKAVQILTPFVCDELSSMKRIEESAEKLVPLSTQAVIKFNHSSDSNVLLSLFKTVSFPLPSSLGLFSVLVNLANKKNSWIYETKHFRSTFASKRSSPRLHPRVKSIIILLTLVDDKRKNISTANIDYKKETLRCIEISGLEPRPTNDLNLEALYIMMNVYTALARLAGAIHQVRRYVYDVLYWSQKKSYVLANIIIRSWADILPVQPIEHYLEHPIALSIIYGLTTLKFRHNHSLADNLVSKHLTYMKNKYNFQADTVNCDKLITMFFSHLTFPGVEEAIILLVKRQGDNWFRSKYFKTLIGMLEMWRKNGDDDATAAAIINIIGCIGRTFHQGYANEDLKPFFELSREVLASETVLDSMKEVLVLNLCRLSKVGFENVVDIISTWKPQEMSSDVIDKVLVAIISRRPSFYWAKGDGLAYIKS